MHSCLAWLAATTIRFRCRFILETFGDRQYIVTLSGLFSSYLLFSALCLAPPLPPKRRLSKQKNLTAGGPQPAYGWFLIFSAAAIIVVVVIAVVVVIFPIVMCCAAARSYVKRTRSQWAGKVATQTTVAATAMEETAVNDLGNTCLNTSSTVR